MTALPTQNEAWGFYGTIAHHSNRPDLAFGCASDAIAKATGCSDAAVRAFMDSQYGRHFADAVSNLLPGHNMPDAIDHTISHWMSLTINRMTQRKLGIPAGLPYLTGFVQHAAIEAEAE